MDWRKSSRSVNNGACVEVATSWRTSSHSMSNGDCVEVASLDGLAVLVRDSTDPGGTVLALTPDAWRDLTGRLQVGDGLDG